MRHGGAEAVDKTHVVVARDIGYHLRRFDGPRLLGIVDARHVDLRMADGPRNAILQTLLAVGQPDKEATLGIVVERSAQSVPNLVAEGGNARHLRDIGLRAQPTGRQGARPRAPPLAIDEDGGVYGVEHLTYLVHGLDIVHTHQVETETVDMVLLRPIANRLQHEAPHHRLLGGCLIATARAVAAHAIVIVGIGLLEVGVVDVVGMVVHHIEDNPDTGTVQRLYHLLELADAHQRLGRVGGVRPLRNIIVHRVVAPVVLRALQVGLVDRAEIVAGQDMDGINAQVRQMAYSPRLGECEELAGMLRLRAGNGKVTVVQFIDDEIGRSLQRRSAVALPPFRVGVAKVDDIGRLTVDAHRLGEDPRRVAMTGIEHVGLPFLVTLDGGRPEAVGSTRHLDAPLAYFDVALGIVGGKEPEGGLLWRIGEFVEAEVLRLKAGGERRHQQGCEQCLLHIYRAISDRAKPPPGA